MVIVISS